MNDKFRKIENTKGQYIFYCPGCKCHHAVWTENEGYEHPIWGWNKDVEKPTVSPSIKVEYHGADKNTICHSFIRNGNIEYLSDCTHELAGKTVELPNIDEND